MNNNVELLQWAVENIKEWDDSFTHLRADTTGVFYTEGDGWKLSIKPLCWYRDVVNDVINPFKPISNLKFDEALVITKQEWLNAVSKSTAEAGATKPPHKEWNIRHFRENKHVSKGCYSITILYREVGKNKYEYKLAVCNPKDQFERSKGIQAALAKDSYVISTSKEHLELSVVWHHILTNVSYGSKLHLFLLSIMSDITNIF